MSDKLLSLIPGLNLADSFTWDPHKAMDVPLQTTVYCHRHPGLLKKSNSAQAGYLFHRERESYDSSLDTGDGALQCGRHIDVMKLWTYFKGKGLKALSDDM